ncbi:MAG: phytanoyl-CoA dioxygenase family protein [Elusimicrobia bacterium]|nr:phytanoyl-CoA dioxygenase family protein [Elusimicrobiota bacterium]
MELSLKQKRQILDDGYTILPGVVGQDKIDEALREINHRLGAGRHQGMDAYADARDYWSEDVDAPALLALIFETPLWGLAESLIGKGKLTRPNTAQIALRFPAVNNSHGGPAFHVDGFYSSDNAPHGKGIDRFTMLAGILLSDAPKKYMGNFTACPGSHRQLAQYIKSKGHKSLASGIGDKIELPDGVQITGKAGDAFLAHYQLAHDKEQNLSPHIRYMAYFRLWHADAASAQVEGLTDIWREWPAIRALSRKTAS